MEITVLGCYGPYPAPGEATSGYLIRVGGRKILLDLGAGALGKMMKILRPEELDCVLFSHLHYDHMSDAFVLRYYLELNRGKLDVYVPAEERSERRTMLDTPVFRVHDLPESGEVCGIQVSSFPVKHPVPCRAIRLEAEGKTFVFTGDTNYFEGLEGFCRGADVLFADSAFTREQWGEAKPHMSAELCGRLAAESSAGGLYLTHLNPQNDPAQLISEAEEGCRMSGKASVPVKTVYPGLTVMI